MSTESSSDRGEDSSSQWLEACFGFDRYRCRHISYPRWLSYRSSQIPGVHWCSKVGTSKGRSRSWMQQSVSVVRGLLRVWQIYVSSYIISPLIKLLQQSNFGSMLERTFCVRFMQNISAILYMQFCTNWWWCEKWEEMKRYLINVIIPSQDTHLHS
jgi:hypothetical protein